VSTVVWFYALDSMPALYTFERPNHEYYGSVIFSTESTFSIGGMP
jgi:hypothetical protein